MSSYTVYSAFKRKLDELSPGIPVIDDDQLDPALEQGETPFISLADGFSSEELTSFGDPSSGCFLEEGTMEIGIFSPTPQGLQSCRLLADQVREHVRFWRESDEENTVNIREALPPGPGEIANGLWHSMIVQVSYDYRYFRQTDRGTLP